MGLTITTIEAGKTYSINGVLTGRPSYAEATGGFSIRIADKFSNYSQIYEGSALTDFTFDGANPVSMNDAVTKANAIVNFNETSGGGQPTIGQDVFTVIAGSGDDVGFATQYRKDNPGFYGPIGDNAIDLTYSISPSSVFGVLGGNGIGVGFRVSMTGPDCVGVGHVLTCDGNNIIGISRLGFLSGQDIIGVGKQVVVAADGSVMVSHFGSTTNANATGVGNNIVISGDRGTSIGESSAVNGRSGFAGGSEVVSRSALEVALQPFSTVYVPVSATSFELTDRVFIVGKGADDANRSDALTILKNGKTGIDIDNFETTTEAAKLQVNGTVHSNASNSEIEAGTSGVLTTKDYVDGRGDFGTTGLLLLGNTSGGYNVTSQRWEWRHIGGGCVYFKLRLEGISGTGPTGECVVDFGGTTMPQWGNDTSKIEEMMFNVRTLNFGANYQSILARPISSDRITFMIQQALDGTNRFVPTDLSFTAGNAEIFISGVYFTDI